MITAAAPRPRAYGRVAYAALTATLLAMTVLELATHDTGYWQLVVFALGPDAALLFGAGAGLAKGQLHPRAVRPYNAAHRSWGPVALAVVAGSGLLSVGYLVGTLAWALHVSLDRALGYGLRTRDGFQRP
jgi:Domain of unknown function (DUF4260)